MSDKVSFEYEMPAEDFPELLAAFTDSYNYQPTIRNEKGDEVENPETPAAFTLARVTGFINEVIAGYRKKQADIAAAAALAEATAKRGTPNIVINVKEA